MTEIQLIAAQTALKRMVAGGFFDICTVDKILQLTNTIPNGEHYRTLTLLHCVKFMDMPPKLLKELPGLIRACLNGVSLEFSFTAPVIESRLVPAFQIVEEMAERRGFFRSLMP